jgi:hypothetical protein
MTNSSDRCPDNRLPAGTDRMAEETDDARTPHFAGTGQLRRSAAAPHETRIAEDPRFTDDVAIQQLREGRARDLAPQVPRPRQSLRLTMFAWLAAGFVIGAAATLLVLQIIASWRVSSHQSPAGVALQSAEASARLDMLSSTARL